VTNYPCIEELTTEEAKMARALARQFVENEIIPVRQQIDDDKDHTKVIEPIFRKILIDLGFQKVMASEQVGSVVNQMGFLEEIARGDSGIAVALGCTGWCLMPLIYEPYKRADLLEELTARFQEDEVHFGCFAMTEPEGGCDIENPRMEGRRIHTKACLDGDEWVINGVKQWPSNSGIASLYCTVCTTDPDLGDEGIAMIYVPYPTEGVSFSRFENKAGMQADRNCTIFYDDVRVPRRYRAAGPRDDANLLHQNLVAGSVGSAAMSVGTAQSILEIVTDYSTKRVVAGKPIKEHSVNACALADMAIGIETARTYALNIAYMFDRPEIYGPRWSAEMLAKARIAKVYAADMSIMVANRAMEMMGSYGYTRDADVEKHWRDNKMMQQWLGGSQLARLDIARHFCNLELL
jgi:alkylation response protein AidB-like acyl-CoA dehydrogenase